ncbi:MAG TPA: TIGR00268 family protein, partial [Thermoplasmata archaeon]|nr:TIGR00268 family protein [Thermoplasmata archaeon]
YRSNPSNRCYFCRTVESRAILDATAGRGFGAFLDGIQRDDLGDDRPGIRAMDEAGFQHPLLDARWGKVEVRTFARSAGLPNWDAPSEACLASRIRHGQEVTRPLLGRIESAERSVRALGFLRVRVRVDGGAARVEVDPPEVDRLRSEPTSSRVVAELLGLGFTGVSLDPSGYRGAAGA